MRFETQDLDIADLERAPPCPLQATLFKFWRETKGKLPEFEQFKDAPLALQLTIPHIITMGFSPKTGDLTALSKGPKSLAAKWLGDDWQQELAQAEGKEAIVAAYQAASEGYETFDYVTYQGLRDFKNFHVSNTRLVLPFVTSAGYPMYMNLSTLVRITRDAADQQSPCNLSGPSLLASSPILLGKDVAPSSKLVGFAS